ncbi:MAG: hypothetical protein ACYSTT_16920 [Planctomycetota bacterium]
MEKDYEVKNRDYLELWMYFQDKAISVKGAMFNTITWLVGFATALLAFIFANLTDSDPLNGAESLLMLTIVASFAGLIICLYAFFALCEADKRIKEYWGFANEFYCKIKWSSDKILPNETEKIPAVVTQLFGVVMLFTIVFLFILGWLFLFKI